MKVKTLQRQGRRLSRGGEDDEDIPSTPPLSPTPLDDEDIIAKKSNEIRIVPITRARAMLLEQHVNSLFT
jgi:hypothetical protein